MKRFLVLTLVIAPILTLVSASERVKSQSAGKGITVTRPAEVGFSAERLARIRAGMQRYIDRGQVPGVVTLVARRGRVVHFEAQGNRDAESRSPMTTETIFRIASMTKPVASVALMMLYEEGHFLLSDPISKFLPEFREMKVAVAAPPEERGNAPYKLIPAARPITFKHVLTHTAGFTNSYRGITQPEYAKVYPRKNSTETVADVLKRLAAMPLNFQPGEAWEYGPATDVVGRLVEVISRETLDNFFRKRIFAPLRMADTHFYLPASKLSRLAASYEPDAKNDNRIKLVEAPNAESRWVKEPHNYFSGAGGLVSTAADYFRFHQMMLNGGELDGVRILGRKTVELMTTNHIGNLPVWITGPGFGFGLGYSVVKDIGVTAQAGTPGTYGWGGAFCTYFQVDPKEEMIAIMMTQVRPYTHLNIRQEFMALAYQSLVDNPRPPAMTAQTTVAQ